MKAYYFDNLPGDQRLPHDSYITVPSATLDALGVLHWSIPLHDGWESEIDRVAGERDYKNRDVVLITKEGLGDAYESKIQMFYAEHMHDDEEIRYILEGSGFFDVREHSADAWIRLHLTAGDLIVLPAGIYHRFSVDEANMTRTMRLFKDEPKWAAHNRSSETDMNPNRLQYLRSISAA